MSVLPDSTMSPRRAGPTDEIFRRCAGRVPVQAGVSALHYGKLFFFAPSPFDL
jgi:hypothetical protein